ncbi:MAG TPA: hypothetical protein VFE24_17250 [Pirellulales bacterium]|jgi:hypothetical protein|nr:hypothetical protein [Pirellulales bacterium]
MSRDGRPSAAEKQSRQRDFSSEKNRVILEPCGRLKKARVQYGWPGTNGGEWLPWLSGRAVDRPIVYVKEK